MIDLNSDLGEHFGRWTFGNDDDMLDLVSSANIACGFHAGDPRSIRKTVRAAHERGVVIGAHVGYHDLAGFGRRNIDVESADLVADVIYQIGALQGIAASVGASVRYVKPHGALYNTIAHDPRQAADVIEAIREIDATLPIVGLAGSQVLRLAEEAGLRPIAEAFADRAYTPQGALVSRREAGAVLHDPELVAARMRQLVQEGTVTAIDGSTVRVSAESICVHGDNPEAVAMAAGVRRALTAANVEIRSFLDAPHPGSQPSAQR